MTSIVTAARSSVFAQAHFEPRSEYPAVSPPSDNHFVATPISFSNCGAGITSCMIQRM